jgi:hypothetical protein
VTDFTLDICNGCKFPVYPGTEECPLMGFHECDGPSVHGTHPAIFSEVIRP